jgi:hypothetical protein
MRMMERTCSENGVVVESDLNVCTPHTTSQTLRYRSFDTKYIYYLVQLS